MWCDGVIVEFLLVKVKVESYSPLKADAEKSLLQSPMGKSKPVCGNPSWPIGITIF